MCKARASQPHAALCRLSGKCPSTSDPATSTIWMQQRHTSKQFHTCMTLISSGLGTRCALKPSNLLVAPTARGVHATHCTCKAQRPSEGHIRISPSSETLQLLLLTHLNMYTEPANKHNVAHAKGVQWAGMAAVLLNANTAITCWLCCCTCFDA